MVEDNTKIPMQSTKWSPSKERMPDGMFHFDPDDPIVKRVNAYMEQCKKKYQYENPCPNCKSHNTHLEPIAINGPDSCWVEYCDDCGWERETSTKTGVKERIVKKDIPK